VRANIKLLHILAAEDNEADVLLFQKAFAHHAIEHELHVTPDGKPALDYIARMGTREGPPCPDIMLLDLNLPKVDGTTILQEFRRHPACARTPVIVVTSSDAEKDRVKVGAFNVSRYFHKPSDFDAFMELGAVVREAVDRQTAERTLNTITQLKPQEGSVAARFNLSSE
jgi:DNA-binding response OmpR family regulator